MRDELQQRRFASSQVLLDRLLAGGAGLGELYFFQGELYRLRGQDGDREKAEQAYRTALEHQDAPAETYRELGLIHLKAGDKRQAASDFKRYLERKPDAADRQIIQTYLEGDA